MNDYKEILDKLQSSRFRGSFHLSQDYIELVNEKGLEKMKSNALEILNKRIRKKPENDGRQTPWKGYPVFVAQHATATCCRKCIEKWHLIPSEKDLADKEINYLSDIILLWIKSDMERKI